jgi:hypothetical protein
VTLQCDDAIRKLSEKKLAVHNQPPGARNAEGRWTAVPLKEALAMLDQEWRAAELQ